MLDADKIASTVPLTTELLIEKVFGGCRKTLKIKRRERQLIRFISETIKDPNSFSNDKQFVIYCMLRLWYDGRVHDLDFKAAWEAETFNCLDRYKRWYYSIICKKQQRTIVV